MCLGKPALLCSTHPIRPLLTPNLFTGDVDEATAQVAALAADPQLRARVGAAAREEVSLWDWRAATQHLLEHQYPIAIALAAAQYGRAAGRAAEAAGLGGAGGGGEPTLQPAPAA